MKQFTHIHTITIHVTKKGKRSCSRGAKRFVLVTQRICSDRFTDNLTRGQVAFSKCQLILQLSKIAEKIPPGKPTTKPLDYFAIRLNLLILTPISNNPTFWESIHGLAGQRHFRTLEDMEISECWHSHSKLIQGSYSPPIALPSSSSAPPVPVRPDHWWNSHGSFTLEARSNLDHAGLAKKPQTRRKGQAPASHALRGGSCETPTPQIMTNLSPHLGILYEYLDKILGLPMKMMEDEVENHRHHHRKNHRPGLKGQPQGASAQQHALMQRPAARVAWLSTASFGSKLDSLDLHKTWWVLHFSLSFYLYQQLMLKLGLCKCSSALHIGGIWWLYRYLTVWDSKPVTSHFHFLGVSTQNIPKCWHLLRMYSIPFLEDLRVLVSLGGIVLHTKIRLDDCWLYSVTVSFKYFCHWKSCSCARRISKIKSWPSCHLPMASHSHLSHGSCALDIKPMPKEPKTPQGNTELAWCWTNCQCWFSITRYH